MSKIDIFNSNITIQIPIAVRQPCSPDWNWDCRETGYQPGNLIWLVEGGAAEFSTPFGEYSLQQGDFLLMPGGKDYGYWGRHNPDNPFIVSWMHIECFDAGGLRTLMPGEAGIPFYTRLRDFPFADRLMRRIIATRGNEQIIWLQALMSEVARQNRQSNRQSAANAIIDLCEAIRQDPGHYQGLDDMQFPYACTKDHFIRLFKKHTGITPGDFLIKTRITNARQLLRVPNLSIKEISSQLGYPDSCSFSKQFKARTGQSPSAYKRQIQPPNQESPLR